MFLELHDGVVDAKVSLAIDEVELAELPAVNRSLVITCVCLSYEPGARSACNLP